MATASIPWPRDPATLTELQHSLAGMREESWSPSPGTQVAGCFVCFARGRSGAGDLGDRGWAAATLMRGPQMASSAIVAGTAAGPYMPGLLAIREGPLLESAVTTLARRPHVLLVNATGWDHPRRAGLALHLGWVLGVPTVGVTHRPLLATGEEAADEAGSVSPLRIGEDQVGWWVRTRAGARPLAVSPGWGTDLDLVVDVVMGAVSGVRTPEAIRQARRLSRSSRARDSKPRSSAADCGA